MTLQKVNFVISDAISARTQLVLVNGIFLKGAWLTPFRVENTDDRSFSPSPGVEIKVPIMHLTGKFRAGEDQNLGAKWVELPFDVSIQKFNSD